MSVFCCHHHCHFRRHVLRKYMQCRHLTVNLRHRCGGRIIAFASGETVPVSLLLLSSTASVYLKLPKNHCVLYSELGVHLDSLEGTLLLPNCSMYENDFGTAHTHSSTGHLFFGAFFANVVQCGRHRLAFFGHVCPVLCIGWTLMDGGCTSLTMKVLSASALRVNGVLSQFVLFSFFYNFPNPGKTQSGGGEDNLSVTNQCW